MPGSQIYIRGHGNPGIPYIQVKVDTGGDEVEERKLLITEACHRLIESGLEKQFSGMIKFFHCHSATVLTPEAYKAEVDKIKGKNRDFKRAYKEGLIQKNQRDAWILDIHPNKSIARNGADYLRKQGFKSCAYYGYLGPLASEYADLGHGEWHKEVNLAGLQNVPAHLAGRASARASQGRVQV